MSLVQVYLLEGRTEEQKHRVKTRIAEALQQATGETEENIQVWIAEVPKANWGIAGKSAAELKR